MSWIEPDDVTAIYSDADVSQAFIDHVQALAESCTGEQTEPSARLKAEFIEVVYRKYLSGQSNPEGVSMEVLGSYTRQHSGAPGLAITRTECKALKRAAGVSSIGVLRVGTGPLETPPLHPDDGEPIEEVYG